MKNLKKVLSVLLVVAMLAATMVPAFAAETATISADAKICADIGMLIGEGSDGVTADYTKTAPTRIQAAIMLLRLKGLAADAAKFDSKDNFADVKGDEWFAPYTAYLKANPSVGFVGVEDGKFAAEELITAQQYYKVVLTALGYVADKDYAYADTIKFAAEKGLKLVADVTAYTVNDLAIATVEALKTTVKDGTKTLTTVLVEAKAIDAAKATAAGIYNPVVAPAMTATIVGKAKFNVAFNTAVDSSKATITVKKGSIAYNTKTLTWAEDKKSVVIEMASALTKGDYEITVAGLTDTALTAKVTAEDQKVTKVEFVTDTAVISRTSANDVNVSYKVFNQYNEAVTGSYGITATSSFGTQSGLTSGTVKISNPAGFKAGDKVAVSLLHVDSGSFVSAVLNVVDKAQVADVAIKSLVLKDSKDLDTSKTASDYKLEVEFKDQFGNVMKEPADVAADIMVTVSDPSKVTVNGGTSTVGTVASPVFTWDSSASKMYLSLAAAPTLTAGTSKITFISKTTGKLASFDIVVKETAKVDTLTVSAPELAVVGETVKIPFTAVDQFGNAITSASVLTAGMTSLTSSVGTISFVQDYVNNKADLVLDLSDVATAQTVVITGITNTSKLVQLSVSAVATRKPVLVSSYTSAFTPNLAVGATSDLRNDRIVVKDQYGRDITTIRNYTTKADDSIYTQYRIAATSGSTSYVKLSGTETVTSGTYYVASTARDATGPITFKGVAKGSSTITLKLQKADGTDITGSEYVFTAKVVEKADIVSYELAEIATLYDAGATGNANYKKPVTVNGVLTDGTKVVVPSTYYTVTTGLNTSVAGYVYAAGETYVGTDTETTVPVVVTVAGASGASILTQSVKVSKVAPETKTLSIVTSTVGNAKPEGNNVISTNVANADSFAEIEALATSAIKNVDQYGVENTSDTYSVIVTNLTSGKTIAGVNGETVSNVVAGNTFNVTAVTANGLAITFKVILK